MTYNWTDNVMAGTAECNVDLVNENLMHLKYSHMTPQEGKVVYSVNSANRDSIGYPDFIEKVSNTEVSFKVDDDVTYEPLVLTFPDGTTEIFNSLVNISGGFGSDGTHVILIEKGQAAAIVTSNNITEGMVEPATATDGDYFLDISVKPYVPKKRVLGAWVETQFVKLGQVIMESGTMGTPASYALNGFTIVPNFWASKNTQYVKQDFMGTNLKYVEIYFADSSTASYWEKVEVVHYFSGVGCSYGATVEFDSTNIRIHTGLNGVRPCVNGRFGGSAINSNVTGSYKIISRRAF